MKKYCLSYAWGENKGATSKARNDAETIARNCGYNKINLDFSDSQRWKKLVKLIPTQSTILIQYPFDRFDVEGFGIKGLKKKDCTIIYLIHDMESLRSNNLIRRIYHIIGEQLLFSMADYIICHNTRMKSILCARGVLSSKLITLDIFDYLVPQAFDKVKKVGRCADLVVAGNLSRMKSQYLYLLQDNNMQLNLYGGPIDENYTWPSNIAYHGMFKPDEVIYVMNGRFGLVWDGDSLDKCTGISGKYVRYNNPHKVSLYLASGIPVIIWSKAAMSDFIRETNTGLIVDSMKDLPSLLERVDEVEYEKIKRNVDKVGALIRNGYYLSSALNKVNG